MLLYSSAAEVVARLLVELSLATAVSDRRDWPVYAPEVMPDERPDKALAARNTNGRMDGRLMRGGTVIEHYGVQVEARALTFADARDKLAAVAEAMSAADGVTVTANGHSYKVANVSRSGGVGYLGPEKKGRRECLTLNFVATIRET